MPGWLLRTILVQPILRLVGGATCFSTGQGLVRCLIKVQVTRPFYYLLFLLRSIRVRGMIVFARLLYRRSMSLAFLRNRVLFLSV